MRMGGGYLRNIGYQLWKTPTLACIALALTLYYAVRPYFNRRRYPPGPLPLPFIGHTYILFSSNIGKSKYDRWKKYGSVVSYVFPSLSGWGVELFGYKTVREALVKHADQFSDRPPAMATNVFEAPGLIFEAPNVWPLLRSHAVMVLKEHGIGKSSVEPKISTELMSLVSALDQLTGPVRSSKQLSYYITLAVSNLTNEVIFGRRLEYNEELATSLCVFPHYFLSQTKYASFFIFKLLPWDVTRYRYMRKHYEICKEFFMSEIRKRRLKLDPDHPVDYIESYLTRGVKTGEPCFNDDVELFSCISQLYIAGSDTTAATLHWTLFYLVNYPDEQEKLYQEICHVLGAREVCLEDKKAMHYTQAYIWEILRLSNIATTTLPHYCNEDTVIDGHLIPKGTKVLINLWSVNHDETVFPDPEEFIPERFLNSDGEYEISSAKPVLSFSIGRRVCPGADFAKTMLFMFLVTLVQRYKFSRTTVEKLPHRGYMGLGYSCVPFDLVMTSRQ